MKPNESPPPKMGAGHAAAMFRQGLSELRGALYPDSNVAQPAQYGLYGTKTPGEVADARREDTLSPDEEPRSVVAERLARADCSRAESGRDDPSPTKE